MIKNTILIASSLLLFINTLNARENPFIATDKYNQERAKIQKMLELSAIKKETPKALSRTIKLSGDSIQKKKIVIITDNQIKQKIIIKKKKKIVIKKKKKIVVPINEIINPIKYTTIHTNKNKISINSKYKLKDYFILMDETKIILDYYASNLHFYTYHHDIKIQSTFNKIAIGNHPKQSYFRIVITTKNNASHYKLNINKNNLVTITRKQSN